MQTIEFGLRSDYIALDDLLKLTGLAESGGRAKVMVSEGLITIDGKVESRKTAKIRSGQTVECGDARIVIAAAPAVP